MSTPIRAGILGGTFEIIQAEVTVGPLVMRHGIEGSPLQVLCVLRYGAGVIPGIQFLACLIQRPLDGSRWVWNM